MIEATMTCFFATEADGSVVIWGGPACFQPSQTTQRALKSGISSTMYVGQSSAWADAPAQAQPEEAEERRRAGECLARRAAL